MRTKLFIAALAVLAFAALPAVASAESAELRDINGEDPGSIRLFSTNLQTETGGPKLACAEAEINATRRGVGRYTVRNSRFEGGVSAGTDRCPVLGTGGRVTTRVRPIQFRDEIHFRREAGGVIKVHTRADFELLFIDPTLGGAFRECKYEVTLQGTMVNDVITIENSNPKLVVGGDRFNTGCFESAKLTGEFRVSDRAGAPVTAH